MVDNERLRYNFEAASLAVRKQMGGKAGASAEKVYGQAYGALVAVGLKPALRARYR